MWTPSKIWVACTNVCTSILLDHGFNYLSAAQREECRNFPVSDAEGTDHVNTLVSLAKLRVRRLHSSDGRQWNPHRSLLKITPVAFNLSHQSSAYPTPSLQLSGPASLLLFAAVFYPLSSTASSTGCYRRYEKSISVVHPSVHPPTKFLWQKLREGLSPIMK